MSPDRDPGWIPALRGILLAPVAPFVMMIWQQRETRIDLIRLRAILVGMLTMHAFLLTGLNFIHPFGPVSLEGRDLLYASLVAGSGLYSMLAPRLLLRQQAPTPETPEEYAAVYRARFFVSLGMAMTPGLFGFVCSFILGRWWVYLVGLHIHARWRGPPRADAIVARARGRRAAGERAGVQRVPGARRVIHRGGRILGPCGVGTISG